MSDLIIRLCGHGRDARHLIAAETDAGQRWLDEHVVLDRSPRPDGVFAAYPHHAEGLVEDAIADGLSVEIV
jgi:hypothetical protein